MGPQPMACGGRSGPAAVSPPACRWQSAAGPPRAMAGACAKGSPGARKPRPGAPANATQRRCPAGARTRGPPSTRGASPAAAPLLQRRGRGRAPFQGGADVGAGGPAPPPAGVVAPRPSRGARGARAGGEAGLPPPGPRPRLGRGGRLAGTPAPRGVRPEGQHLGWGAAASPSASPAVADAWRGPATAAGAAPSRCASAQSRGRPLATAHRGRAAPCGRLPPRPSPGRALRCRETGPANTAREPKLLSRRKTCAFNVRISKPRMMP
jgi:hypothetical protein